MPLANERIPEFVIVKGPAFVVVTFPLIVNVDPARAMPEEPDVDTEPLNDAVPMILDKFNEPAEILEARVTLLALVISSAPSGDIEPTALLKKMFPAPAVKVIAKFPSTVLFNVMFPLVLSEAGARSVIAPVAETEPCATIEPPRCKGPVPFCIKALSIRVMLPGAPVIFPAFVMVSDPPPPMVRLPLREKLFPINVTPAGAVVTVLPIIVVVPVPDSWLNDPALSDLKLTLFALLTVIEATGVVDPMIPETAMFPAPAVNVNGSSPSIVCEIAMLPPPEFSEAGPVSIIGLAKERLALDVVIAPPNETLPEPVWLKAPEDENVWPGVNVNCPLLAMEMGPEFAVAALPSNVNTDPERLMPAEPFVFRLPLKSVVPIPED